MEKYDAVVIGAGNGGLTASAGLARKGLNVLLLERHNIPGGCATSFCRGRFEFEVALHQLSGMGTPEKPGPLRMSLASLGVLDDLEFVAFWCGAFDQYFPVCAAFVVAAESDCFAHDVMVSLYILLW